MGNDNETPTTDAVDPKEQMRLALERKKQASHHANDGTRTELGKPTGNAHGPAGGKKQFTRRKAGG